ncbi:MAG: hypothetical protein PHZ00_07475 [Candidatus Peribacteraceae bacterium]|nr:hypothetical protein [Candidatus Peribacteraceae bacterium]
MWETYPEIGDRKNVEKPLDVLRGGMILTSLHDAVSSAQRGLGLLGPVADERNGARHRRNCTSV